MKIPCGYTLFEVLIVMMMILVLLSIGTIPLKHAKERFDVEQDIRAVYGLLQKGRMYAFTNKERIYLDLIDKCLKRSRDNSIIQCVKLKRHLYSNCNNNSLITIIQISERGIFETFCTVYYLSNRSNLNPTYSCLVTSITKVRLGVYHETTCIEK